MSSWLIPPRFSGRRAPRAPPPSGDGRFGGRGTGQRNLRRPSRLGGLRAAASAGSGPASAISDLPISGSTGSEAAAASAAPVEVATAFVMSSRTMPTGSKLVSIFAWSLIAWNSFFTLSRSASRSTSRIASMNWPWNWAAMRRILPSVCPTVRMTRGRSFGGITANATMPTMIILLRSRSNMAHRTGRPNSVNGGARRYSCRRTSPLRAFS